MHQKSITRLEFDAIEKGFFSGITEKKNIVISPNPILPYNKNWKK